MKAIDFSGLDLLPKMLDKLEYLESKLENIEKNIQPKYDLTKRDGVKKYLNITDGTISNYIKQGCFIRGYHYNREIKNNRSIITFVSGAIEEFKKEKTK